MQTKTVKFDIRATLAALAIAPSALILAPSAMAQTAQEQGSAEAELPLAKYLDYDMFELDNGLRVLVHEDRSNPAVTVAVYVQVGAKDEPEGKTGFAHLFEHMLFIGTPTNPGEFFAHLDEIGGSGANGTTDNDRTNYFETVPTGALERVLWLEADRMGNILGGLTEEQLKTQIEVVKNEKGLSDNQPFGASVYESTKAIYPAGHPYSHTVIGSIEDLESATLEDVHNWYKKYYGANNSILVLSGDIDAETARPLVEKYFNFLKPGPPITRQHVNAIKRDTETELHSYDVAPNSEYARSYILPAQTSRENYMATLALDIFGTGENSRLYQGLVRGPKLALRASGGGYGQELDTFGYINAVSAKRGDLNALASTVDTLMAEYLKSGPTQSEIDRRAGSLRNSILEIANSAPTKLTLLAEGLVTRNNPHHLLQELAWIESATPEEVRKAANQWLSRGYHSDFMIAESEKSANPPRFAEIPKPEVKPTRSLDLPKPEIFTLSNGVEVVFHRRTNAPNIFLNYQIPVGNAHLSAPERLLFEHAPNIISEIGAGDMTRKQLAELKERKGIRVRMAAGRYETAVRLSVAPDNFDDGFRLWTEFLTQPQIDQEEFSDMIDLQIRDLQQNYRLPDEVGTDLHNVAVRGDENVNQIAEEEAFLRALTPQAINQFHKRWIRPKGATIYAVGDITKADLVQRLERSFRSWSGDVPNAQLAKPNFPAKANRPRFIIVEKKGSSQTGITAERLVNLAGDTGAIRQSHVESMMNAMFGGNFSSRINLNIREDKGWTYGIGSSLNVQPNSSSFAVGSSVTAANTVDAVKEIIREMKEAETSRPFTKTELQTVVEAGARAFSSRLGNNRSIAGLYSSAKRLGQDPEFFEGYPQQLRSITVEDTNAVARQALATNDLVWLLVGDPAQFEDALRAANLGDIEVYDRLGKRIR